MLAGAIHKDFGEFQFNMFGPHNISYIPSWVWTVPDCGTGIEGHAVSWVLSVQPVHACLVHHGHHHVGYRNGKIYVLCVCYLVYAGTCMHAYVRACIHTYVHVRIWGCLSYGCETWQFGQSWSQRNEDDHVDVGCFRVRKTTKHGTEKMPRCGGKWGCRFR